MTIYIIRHGHAQDRAVWRKPDIERPLTVKGVVRAEKAFANFFTKYTPPEIIIASEAARSYQTAEVLRDVCGVEIAVENLINPGAEPADYESVIEKYKNKNIAVIGHEPDLSVFVSSYLSEGALFLEMKKGSVCHIENRRLVSLIQQKALI